MAKAHPIISLDNWTRIKPLFVFRPETRSYNANMNKQTEITLKSIFAVDETIDSAQIDSAIKILQSQTITCKTHPTQVIKFCEAARLLHVTAWTVNDYANRGLLERVYGGGAKKAIGISLQSYNRFILLQRTNDDIQSEERMRLKKENISFKASIKAADHSRKIRRVKRLLALPNNASRQQTYEAIKALLGSTKEFSMSLICAAAGMPLTTYLSYRKRNRAPWDEQRKKESVALVLIKELFDTSAVISLREAHRTIQAHGFHITLTTVARLMDRANLIRVKKGTKK